MGTSYIEWLAKIKNFFLDSLFPIPTISSRLPIYKTLFCAICRARLPENKKTCHKSAEYLLGAATNYDQQTIRQAIWRLKYRNRAGLAKLLADVLIKYATKLELGWEEFIIIPIPLSKARLRNRGYNQSELIARIFAANFKIELNKTALVRTKNTAPQMEVRDWETRKNNMIGAFGVAKPELIKGKNIILIDDVFTSGATMSEAAHQLKDFGAKKIIGLVVAKAG